MGVLWVVVLGKWGVGGNAGLYRCCYDSGGCVAVLVVWWWLCGCLELSCGHTLSVSAVFMAMLYAVCPGVLPYLSWPCAADGSCCFCAV